MECSNLLEAALKNNDISRLLYKGSPEKELTTDLQRVLFELGFRKELNWDNYQADGDYGPATTAAVAAFAKKNRYRSNGTKVSNTLAKLMLQRHDFLPDMYILWCIYDADLRTRKYISRGTKMSIMAIQVLLNEKGYGQQLQFDKYGADGCYGESTRTAFIAYANDHGITTDGDWLTRPIVNTMLTDINTYYGRSWSELAKNNLPDGDSPLIYFEGSRFHGQCRADVEFVPALMKINTYAEEADVFLAITSSFRTTTNVSGAIVKPATRSNHLAGHGIDMNVIYGNGKWANSKVLIRYPNVPEPVRLFIKSIIDDPHLRWGGKFRVKDVVHIDDHLNKDLTAWNKRYQVMQRAVQLGV